MTRRRWKPINICQAETLKNAIFLFLSFKLAFYCYHVTVQLSTNWSKHGGMAMGITGWDYFRVSLFGEFPPSDCDVLQEVGNLLRVSVGRVAYYGRRTLCRVLRQRVAQWSARFNFVFFSGYSGRIRMPNVAWCRARAPSPISTVGLRTDQYSYIREQLTGVVRT